MTAAVTDWFQLLGLVLVEDWCVEGWSHDLCGSGSLNRQYLNGSIAQSDTAFAASDTVRAAEPTSSF